MNTNKHMYEYARLVHERTAGCTRLTESHKQDWDELQRTVIVPPAPEVAREGRIMVVQRDVVDAVVEDLEAGYRPLLVIPGDHQQSCGEWEFEDASGIEEHVARRSTLAMAATDALYGEKGLTPGQTVHVPNLVFFRNGRGNVMRHTAACGAIIVPPAMRPDFSIDNDVAKVRARLESVFLTAVAGGYTSVVTPPIGCVKWDNHPEEVAKMFANLLETYRVHFERVTFAFEGDAYMTTFRRHLH